MLDPGEVFFFEQTTRWRPPRRYRKLPDELPQSMKFAHLNRSVQAYLHSKEKEDGGVGAADGDEADVKALKESLLPDISHAVGLLKSRMDEAEGVGSGDFLRAQFNECKSSAASVLELLARWLLLLQQSGRRLQLPRSLEHQLQCCYEELCAGATFTRREWQLASNAVAAAARKAEKAKGAEPMARGDGPDGSQLRDDDASSVRKAGYGRGEDPDSDGDVKDGKASAATSSAQNRVSDAGAAITARGSRNRLGAGDDRSSRGHSRRSHIEPRRRPVVAASARRSGVVPSATALDARLATAPASHRGDDAASSVGTPSSAKSTTGPQPYSVTVLQFNLSNVRALEDKGCKVFGLEENDESRNAMLQHSPLEWAVKRLSSVTQSMRTESVPEKAGAAKVVPYVRYYGDRIFSEKQIEKTFSERLGIYSSLVRGEAVKVPQVSARKQGKQSIMMVQTSDGSQCAFYESGHLALVTSRGSSGAGFYTIAFDESEPARMVASFSPQGRGACYYPSGALRYVVTDEGGALYDEEGECGHFEWPESGKLQNPITFPLSRCLTVRIHGQRQSFLVFTAHSFTLKISICKDEKASAAMPNEVPLLQTYEGEYEFESDYAIELMNQQRTLKGLQATDKKPDKKLVFKLKVSPNAVRKADSKVLESEVDFIKLEKDLDRLRAKSRLLIDDWMETYRIATGMTSPHISRLRDTSMSGSVLKNGMNSRTGLATSHSAKSTPGSFLPAAAFADEDTTSPIPAVSEEERRRVPSAPCNVSMWSLKQEEDGGTKRPRDGGQSTVQFDGLVKFADASDMAATATPTMNANQTTPRQQQQQQQQQQISVSPAHVSPWTTGSFAPWAAPPRGQCPVALRQELLGRGPMPCRCQRRKVPYITDVEFDEFVGKTAPPRQLIIIAVTSSLHPDDKSSSLHDMLERMHSDRNAHRAMPCLQARADPFRVFRYDLSTAHFDSGNKQALLTARHGATAGMFLIYESGRLLFCDRVFNGYSNNARSDFQKQLNECRRLAVAGSSLPADFKFSSAKVRRSIDSTKSRQKSEGSASTDRFLMPLGSKATGSAAHKAVSPTPAPVEYSTGAHDEAPVSPRHKQQQQGSITARLLAVKVNQSAPPQQRFFKGSSVLAHSAR